MNPKLGLQNGAEGNLKLRNLKPRKITQSHFGWAHKNKLKCTKKS
jgi:hypothetical protein